MTMKVLVSGNARRVPPVAQAVRDLGAEATEVVDLSSIGSACADVAGKDGESDGFDSYIQMGQDFTLRGETAVQRVHGFYADGVLARYSALDAVLPWLRKDARITFVMGHLPPEVSSTEDWDARHALTLVLTRAAQADQSPGRLDTEILDSGTDPAEIAQVALGRRPATVVRIPDDDLDYADWRVEVLGLAMFET